MNKCLNAQYPNFDETLPSYLNDSGSMKKINEGEINEYVLGNILLKNKNLGALLYRIIRKKFYLTKS